MKLRIFGIITVFVLVVLNIIIVPSSIAGTVTVNVSAIITTSITETVTTNLDFGSIDLDPAGDTITIDADPIPGVPVATAASVITGGTSGLVTITSGVVAGVAVVYPAADVTLTNAGGDTLTIVAATIAAQSSESAAATDGTNPLLIYVGGVIVIPAGQAAGTYTGSMSITINYS